MGEFFVPRRSLPGSISGLRNGSRLILPRTRSIRHPKLDKQPSVPVAGKQPCDAAQVLPSCLIQRRIRAHQVTDDLPRSNIERAFGRRSASLARLSTEGKNRYAAPLNFDAALYFPTDLRKHIYGDGFVPLLQALDYGENGKNFPNAPPLAFSAKKKYCLGLVDAASMQRDSGVSSSRMPCSARKISPNQDVL